MYPSGNRTIPVTCGHERLKTNNRDPGSLGAIPLCSHAPDSARTTSFHLLPASLRRMTTVAALAAITVALLVPTAGCDTASRTETVRTAQGAEPSGNSDPRRRPVVLAADIPIRWFAEQLAVDSVDVRELLPPQTRSSDWKPTAEDVARLQAADLLLLDRSSSAAWMDQVSLPRSRCVDVSRDIRDELIYSDDNLRHQHGPSGNLSNQVRMPCPWLDVSLAIRQAATVRDAFARLLPNHADSLRQRFSSLETQLLETDECLKRAFAAAAGRQDPSVRFFAVGSDYAYLERHYSLKIQHGLPPLSENRSTIPPPLLLSSEDQNPTLTILLTPRSPPSAITRELQLSRTEVLVVPTFSDEFDTTAATNLADALNDACRKLQQILQRHEPSAK